MADNSESAQGTAENQGANPEASQAGGQPASASLDDALVEKIIGDPRFEERVMRLNQSDKDRRISQLEKGQKETTDRLDRYDQLRAEGKTPQQARQQLSDEDDAQWLRTFRQEYESKNPRSSPPQSDGTEAGLSESVKNVLSLAGISHDDPGVISALQGKSGDAALASATKYALSKREKTAQASPSMIAAPQGNVSASPDAKKKYIDDMTAASGNRAELRRIKDAARKAGVDVDNIGFTIGR